MTTAQQLAAFKPVAKWINHNKNKCRLERFSPWWRYRAGGHAYWVPPTAALALRIDQAMQYLATWCEKHEAVLRIVWEQGDWYLSIGGVPECGRWSGKTLAEALAATVAAMKAIDDQVAGKLDGAHTTLTPGVDRTEIYVPEDTPPGHYTAKDFQVVAAIERTQEQSP